MEISVFIRILRSRLEELSLSAEYIDKKCIDTEKYLLKVPIEDRDAVITENYLNSIIDSTKGEAERLAAEDKELERSIASILEKRRGTTADIPISGDKEEKSENSSSQVLSYESDDAPTIPPVRIKRAAAGPSDTRFADGQDARRRDNGNVTAATIPPKKRDKREESPTDGGKTRPGDRTSVAKEKNSEVPSRLKRDPLKKIDETELYNSRSSLIFSLLLIFFSPTLLLALVIILAALLVTVLVFSLVTAVIIILPFALIFAGCIISVISFSYALSLIISGDFLYALPDMGIFFTVFSVTAFLTLLTRLLLKKALPFLSIVITRSYKTVFRAIKAFLTKCRKGCATL